MDKYNLSEVGTIINQTIGQMADKAVDVVTQEMMDRLEGIFGGSLDDTAKVMLKGTILSNICLRAEEKMIALEGEALTILKDQIANNKFGDNLTREKAEEVVAEMEQREERRKEELIQGLATTLTSISGGDA